MNFKNGTKIVIAALLFANNPIFALFLQKNPVYLRIQNSTESDWNIKQIGKEEGLLKDTIKADTRAYFPALPVYDSYQVDINNAKESIFDLVSSNELLRFKIAFMPDSFDSSKISIYASLQKQKKSGSKKNFEVGKQTFRNFDRITSVSAGFPSDTVNEIHTTVILNGSAANNYLGSKITVDKEALLERQLKLIESKRILEKPQSIEKLLQMQRH
jgi:hypothetical protein